MIGNAIDDREFGRETIRRIGARKIRLIENALSRGSTKTCDPTENSVIAAAINIVRSRSAPARTSRGLARLGSARLGSLSLSLRAAPRELAECVVCRRRAASRTRKRKIGRRRWRRRRQRRRRRWRQRGIRGSPLLPPHTDKNRYYEFTAAPRLRGIATITSSVVARVVGARTPVASPAVANVVDVRRRCRCRRIFMFICDRLRSSSSFWPPPPSPPLRSALRCALYSPSRVIATADQKREINREVDTPDIQGVPRGNCRYFEPFWILGNREEYLLFVL